MAINTAILHSSPKDLDPSRRWVIGAAIFQNPHSPNRTLLLLKRASHETAFPNAWELPGGKVETEYDISVEHAVRREVHEETSLQVSQFIGEIEPMTWVSKRGLNYQLNYVVTVDGNGNDDGHDSATVWVEPNPEEHSDWKWVRETDVDDLFMTPEMREVVRNAFQFAISSS